MEQKYNPHVIEREAQDYWEQTHAFRAEETPGKPKYYCLSMFPYPSGKLHMGHVRNYTIGDVLARYYRMKGCNVLQPMGWDAFGLPAENAAMANGVPPAQWTYDNIAYMKQQLKSLGFAIDWKRELATCKPDYYRWNQWLFLRMLEKGLAYKKTGVVNWDPVDQTVLANEQVIDGRGWRTGAVVEKREIPMYYLAITRYAEELLAALDQLPGWPERVKTMQANWIGKSHGVRFAFPYELDGKTGKALGLHHARRHDHGRDLRRGRGRASARRARGARTTRQLAAFIEECKRGSVMEADLATMEKKGHADRPLRDPSADGRENAGLGRQLRADGLWRRRGHGRARRTTSAISSSRRNTACRSSRSSGRRTASSSCRSSRPTSTTACASNSGKYDGLDYEQAVDAIAADLKAKGLGEKQVLYRLRDWGISRQRYWGWPIPIVHCPACGDVPVPDDQLPVVLPEDCVPDGTGNPLNKRPDFVNARARSAASAARRETDTMDTFVDSSWYYMRFACPDNDRHDGGRARRLLAAGRPVHRRHRARDPAPALLALLDQGDARPRARRVRRAVHRTCSRRAWC